MLVGAVLGLTATALLAEFVMRLDASGEPWERALLVTVFGAVPVTAVGIVVAISLEERRSARVGAPERAPTHPLGAVAALFMACWATVFLLSINDQARELLDRHLGVSGALVATAILVLRVAMLVGIWQVGRATSRGVSEALDNRGGRQRLPDVAIIALLFAFCGLLLTGTALESALSAERESLLLDPAIEIALALIFTVIARALMLRSRYATHLALGFAVSVVVATIVIWVLSPADADLLQGFRNTVLVAVFMAGFVWYVRWRLRSDRAEVRKVP